MPDVTKKINPDDANADVRRRVELCFRSVTREAVVKDIANILDKRDGVIKIANEQEKLAILIVARLFFDEYFKKIITLSDGRRVYFIPGERGKDCLLSNSESWAEYCIHAVTHGGKRVAGKAFNERVWSPVKAENIKRLEMIIKEEHCTVRLDDRDASRDSIIFIGKDADGNRMNVVTRLDEYGNLNADLTEVTAVMTGKIMPPVKLDPPKEAIKKVVLHQTDGYSPLTTSTISNPTNEVKSPVRPYGEGRGSRWDAGGDWRTPRAGWRISLRWAHHALGRCTQFSCDAEGAY